MTYYLNVPGKKAQPISLEELRQRRSTGQLNGSELVWTEGMPQWLPVDALLQNPVPPPLARPSSRSNRTILTVVIVAMVAGLGIVSFLGVVAFKQFRRQIRRQTAQAATASKNATLALAGKAISWNTNTVTLKDVRRHGREFRVRQWLEGYKERGGRNQACDAAALEFLQEWIDANYADSDHRASKLSVTELADRIAANSACKDPLVLTIAGATGIEVFENRRRLELALANFPQSRHRAYPKFYATLLLARDLSDNSGRSAALHSSALALLKEAFKDGSIQAQDQAEMAEIFISTWGKKFFDSHPDAVCEIVKNAGKSFEWLALALDGERHVDLAWQARGNGYADKVTQKGWQGFSQHLDQARTSFTAAWELRPELPLPACRMITVAMGDSDLEEMRLWFDRAVAAQIDVPEAWKNFKWGLRPRWHGSLEAMRAFGVAAVDTKRFDTDVPRKFFDVVKDLESELDTPPGQHIYGRPDLWPHFQRLYEGYIADPAQKESRDGWRNSYCVVAFFAGRYGIAREQLEALNWKLRPSQLTAWGRDLSLMPLEVAARTGPESNTIVRAEAAYQRKDLGGALKAFEPLRASADQRTAGFARARCAALASEQELAKGQWVRLLPEKEDDPNWVIAFGKLKCLPDGVIEVESESKGHMMFSRTRLPSDFEVQGEFEIVRSSNKSFQAGLVLGHPDFEDSSWYSFRMKRNPQEQEIAAFANGWSAKQVYGPVKLDDKRNSFTFRFQHAAATASVNGHEVLHAAKLRSQPEFPANRLLLGIGAYIDSNQTVVRYRNLQVRRLPSTNSN
jgi:GYF domain 2